MAGAPYESVDLLSAVSSLNLLQRNIMSEPCQRQEKRCHVEIRHSARIYAEFGVWKRKVSTVSIINIVKLRRYDLWLSSADLVNVNVLFPLENPIYRHVLWFPMGFSFRNTFCVSVGKTLWKSRNLSINRFFRGKQHLAPCTALSKSWTPCPTRHKG